MIAIHGLSVCVSTGGVTFVNVEERLRRADSNVATEGFLWSHSSIIFTSLMIPGVKNTIWHYTK